MNKVIKNSLYVDITNMIKTKVINDNDLLISKDDSIRDIFFRVQNQGIVVSMKLKSKDVIDDASVWIDMFDIKSLHNKQELIAKIYNRFVQVNSFKFEEGPHKGPSPKNLTSQILYKNSASR
jgi:hypothetical protein